MNRAAGPRPSLAAGNAVTGWIVLAGCWGLLAAAWLTWAAARLAALISGGHVPPFGRDWITALAHGRTSQTWPGTPSPLVAAVGAAFLASAAVLAVLAWQRISRLFPAPGDPVAALRHNHRIRHLAPARAARTAVRLRPITLAGRNPRGLAPADTGLVLGDLKRPRGDGPPLYATWEDTIVAFMAPRSGKTTALAVPYVLSAPGPVVATSVRADLWAATARPRAACGVIWLFDPQRVTHQDQAWWWNPLAGLATVEAAHRLASHFVLTVDDATRRDIWGPAAQELLSSLLLAAAASDRTLREVARWLDDPAAPAPSRLLDDAGFGALASSLRGAQHGAPETRDGIYQTARTAARCLHDEEIMAWVTPPGARLPAFDPAAFARGRDTLYLLTESRAAASPLVAALTDIAMRAARRHAEREAGRLDPPMVLVLDEAANICRIADLPDLYSHLGGRGIIPVTILQSYEQGVTVWGEPGMAALWGAATKKVIGAGVDSPRLTRDLATLIGQHDVPVRSVSYGDGRVSEQISVQRRQIMQPADIRALPPGTALLLATGARPALIQLRPWYAGPSAGAVSDAIRRAEDAMRAGARQASSERSRA